MARSNVNQLEIARSLNLSPATVSRSFKGHPDISESTRQRVWDEAKRIGYKFPKERDAGGGEESVKTVCILLAEHDSASQALDDQYLSGLSEAAKSMNAVLAIHRFEGRGDSNLLKAEKQPAAMRFGIASGLILLHNFDVEVVRELAERFPCATLVHYKPGTRADHVDADHVGGVSDLMDHLVGLGHKRVAFISRTVQTAASRAIHSSFIQSCFRLRLSNESHPYTGYFEYPVRSGEANQMKIQEIIAAIRGGVTALVCDSDGTAYRVYRALTDAGIDVPGEVSITGYNGQGPMYGCPQVTTVKVDFPEIAKVAFHKVMARAEDSGITPHQTLLKAELLLGESTGPVRH